MTLNTPTAPKPTTRKKAARSLRLVRWNKAHRLGVLEITEGRTISTYAIHEVEAGYCERAFKLAKTAVITDKPVSIESEYIVGLERAGHTCECKGHLRHGHKTQCRHIAACLKLIELDLI